MPETIIGPNIAIEGEISGTDSITGRGTVRGRLNVKDQLTIPQGGRVEAEVEAGSIEIAGIIEGNVAVSDKVEIKSGGLLVGDVKAPRVLIADGATFETDDGRELNVVGRIPRFDAEGQRIADAVSTLLPCCPCANLPKRRKVGKSQYAHTRSPRLRASIKHNFTHTSTPIVGTCGNRTFRERS